jgi:hypothetical protein
VSSYDEILDLIKLIVSRWLRREIRTLKARMTERPSASGGTRVGRWVLVFALIVIGIVLYFGYAARTPAVAPPAAQDAP